MSTVLITRPEPDATEFSELLQARGHDTVIEPMLFMKPVSVPPEQLHMVRRQPLQALIATSKHALPFLVGHPHLHRLPILVVGEASAEVARRMGFHAVHVAERAARLPELIRRNCPPMKGGILYIRGRDITLDLRQLMQGDPFPFYEVIVYDMREAAALSNSCTRIVKSEAIDIATFFSARTAFAFVKSLRKAGLEKHIHRTRAIGFSDEVADALTQLPWKYVYSCSEQTVDYMLDKVDKLMQEG